MKPFNTLSWHLPLRKKRAKERRTIYGITLGTERDPEESTSFTKTGGPLGIRGKVSISKTGFVRFGWKVPKFYPGKNLVYPYRDIRNEV